MADYKNTKTTNDIVKFILDTMMMAPDSEEGPYQVHMKNNVTYSDVVFMEFHAKESPDGLSLETNLWFPNMSGEGPDNEVTVDVTQIADIWVFDREAKVLTYMPIK